MSIRCGERPAELGAVPSIGGVGNSFEDVLAKIVNRDLEAEIVGGPEHPGLSESREELELATLGWVLWHNNERLDSHLGDALPPDFGETF